MVGRLFLSGGGNEKQTAALDEIFLKNIKKILYIPIAWPNEDFDSCLKWFKNMLSQHNKKAEINMLTDLTKEIKLKNYDAIYIGGGNTFKLLKKIKESGFGRKILEFYENGGTIYGGSAGAIIFGKDINIAKICADKDVNKVNLKDTSGLNKLKNHDIQCHFEDNQIREHQEYIKDTNRNVLAIPEESCILLEKDKFKVIGLKPVTLITLENIRKFQVNEEFLL